MNNRSNPIGKTAAALMQTPPAKGSVITTLASAILSNYGKLVLLLGAACLIRYVVTHLKSPAQQNIEPSSEFTEDQKQEAREIIREVARHKDVLALLEQKIPGLRDEIHKNLTSSNIDDIRSCLAVLEGPNDLNFIAAIKLGANDWILPKGNKEDHCITLIIDGSESHYMSVNNQIAQAILTQAGVSGKELEQSPENAWLALSINNHQLTEVKGYESKALPLNIEFIHAPKMLPVV